MRIKKIIVYTENYLPSIGGLENNTALLCESLADLKHSVTLITPQKEALKNQKFEVVGYGSFWSIYSKVKSSDLVIINGGVSFKAVIPSILALKPFFIIYQMATLFKDIRKNDVKTKFLNKLREWLAGFSAKNIAVSEYSHHQLKSIFGDNNSAMLINPADPIFLNNATEKVYKPLKCLIAGRLIEGKGIKLLIKAVLEINKETPNSIDLHIVGDGDERKFVEKASNDAHIHYHAPLAKKQLKDFLATINLTIVPSTTHIEGSPLIMAESFSMGIPVLVSSQPALAASVKHKDLIFESGNLASLKAKLQFLTVDVNYGIVKSHSVNISTTYAYSSYLKRLNSIVNV